jgi:hypothetical protein
MATGPPRRPVVGRVYWIAAAVTIAVLLVALFVPVPWWLWMMIILIGPVLGGLYVARRRPSGPPGRFSGR